MSVRLSVCPFVCPLAYLKNHSSQISWDFLYMLPVVRGSLGPPPTAVRHVMYFRFVDDVTFSHSTANEPNKRRRVRVRVLSSSQGGGTGRDVCRLRLHIGFSLVVWSAEFGVESRRRLFWRRFSDRVSSS